MLSYSLGQDRDGGFLGLNNVIEAVFAFPCRHSIRLYMLIARADVWSHLGLGLALSCLTSLHATCYLASCASNRGG